MWLVVSPHDEALFQKLEDVRGWIAILAANKIPFSVVFAE